MRLSKTITLEPGRDATVYELRAKDVRLLLSSVDLESADMQQVIKDSLPTLMKLADDALELPSGETFEDLTLSECEAVGKAWWELHKSFFGPALDLLRTHLMGTAHGMSSMQSSQRSEQATRKHGSMGGQPS